MDSEKRGDAEVDGDCFGEVKEWSEGSLGKVLASVEKQSHVRSCKRHQVVRAYHPSILPLPEHPPPRAPAPYLTVRQCPRRCELSRRLGPQCAALRQHGEGVLGLNGATKERCQRDVKSIQFTENY